MTTSLLVTAPRSTTTLAFLRPAMLAMALLAGGQAAGCRASETSSGTAEILGTAGSFAVLAGSTVTNTGPTTISGNLGVFPGSAVVGFPPGLVIGVIHAGSADAGQAQSDLVIAYDDLAGQPCNFDLASAELAGLTLVPGVYCSTSSIQLTGRVTLDAQGDPDAQFVFKMASTLTTGSGASVLVINGAQSCNTYWQVGSSATLGTDTSFVGNILALTSITLDTGASVSGSVLARNGAVTLDSNNVELTPCVSGGDVDAGIPPVIDGGTPEIDATPPVEPPVCTGTMCGEVCTDLEGDDNNCGACGEVCPTGLWCTNGACFSS